MNLPPPPNFNADKSRQPSLPPKLNSPQINPTGEEGVESLVETERLDEQIVSDLHTPAEEVEERFQTEEKLIRTAEEKEDGLDKCQSCGSTNISYDIPKMVLICADCRNESLPAKLLDSIALSDDIDILEGRELGLGAQNITATNDMVTIKCQGCGAEVVLNTADTMNAKCHWCRQTLTVNKQIPNGAVPDAILPFLITHKSAAERVGEFVRKRRLFAKKDFITQFTPETVKPVYMPYMIVDARFDAKISGTGEVLTRRYTETDSDGDSTTYYDGDRYTVSRDLSILVDDLITESSSERSDLDTSKNTNNIINAILPFDTENLIHFSSHFLKDNTSEKRDMSFDTLDESAKDQFLTIAREKASQTIEKYDRGVRWEQEFVDVKGTRWIAAYLPVWLYSYVEKGDTSDFTHYIAVNGRNGSTMGSVPVSHPKLTIASTLAAIPFVPISFIALLSY